MLRRLISVLVVLVPIALFTVTSSALAAGDANQGSCSASTESSPGFRTYLPDCRAYELVTPAYKEGVMPEPQMISHDGSHMLIESIEGSFAHTGDLSPAAYDLTREGADFGWMASALVPPASEFIKDVAGGAFLSGLLAGSNRLDTTLWKAIPYTSYSRYIELHRFTGVGTPDGLQQLYRRGVTPSGSASFTAVGPLAPADVQEGVLRYRGSSNDLRQVALDMSANSRDRNALFIAGLGPFWRGDHSDAIDSRVRSLYEYEGTGNTEPTLVGVSNEGRLKGSPHINEGATLLGQCGVELGSGRPSFNATSGGRSTYNAVSKDGESVFFTVLATESPGPKAGESRCAGARVERASISYAPPYECKLEASSGSTICPAAERTHIEAKITNDLQDRLDAHEIVDGTSEIGKPFSVNCQVDKCNMEFMMGPQVGPGVDELYVRLGQSKTLAISEPPLSLSGRECTGVCETDENEPAQHKEGVFRGASADGSKVFFTTEQPLVNEDEDTSNDLYMAQIGCPGGTSECEPAQKRVTKLVQLSHDPTRGKPAEVLGVARISQDGDRVYFVAKGKLTTKPNAEGKEPEEEGDNLYVYAEGHLRFVATLLSQAEEAEASTEASRIEGEAFTKAFNAYSECLASIPSGATVTEREADEIKCFEHFSAIYEEELRTLGYSDITETLAEDRSVWKQEDSRPVQATHDGRFLVFPSSAHLTGAEDTSKAPQLFEYDAEGGAGKEGVLMRVSIGQGGYNDNGNVSKFADAPLIRAPVEADYSLEDLSTAANLVDVSEGGAVFFESRDALTPQALSGAENIYEYRGKNVYLISDGRDLRTTKGVTLFFGADASGEDVFFRTANALVPQDTDTQLDVYDARIGGGFPAPGSAGCTGEACRGSLNGAPSLSSLGGSATQAGGDNVVAAPASKTKALTNAQKLSNASKACKRRPKKKRAACEKQARKRYGGKSKAKKSAKERK